MDVETECKREIKQYGLAGKGAVATTSSYTHHNTFALFICCLIEQRLMIP